MKSVQGKFELNILEFWAIRRSLFFVRKNLLKELMHPTLSKVERTLDRGIKIFETSVFNHSMHTPDIELCGLKISLILQFIVGRQHRFQIFESL